MTRLSKAEQQALVDEFVASVKRFTPEWTAQSPDSDPGITFIELAAWLGDVLSFEQDKIAATGAIPEDVRRKLTKWLSKVTVSASHECDTSGGLIRNRYFSGRLLTAEDLQLEQDYFRKKLRLHNRCLFGPGIVTGLDVTLDQNNETVIVQSGCAIDDVGEEIVICDPLRYALKAGAEAGYLSLRYCEKLIDPVVAVPQGDQEETLGEPSHIEESVYVEFGERTIGRALVIARLELRENKWTVDARFQPKRASLLPLKKKKA
jgi:hypothetical protein